VDLTATFLQAVGERMAPAGLTPTVLSQAVADLLPVDGAGLSTLLGALRMPLGGSTFAAGRAEEMQTSIGEGPCLAAAVSRTVAMADLAEIMTRWPTYGDALVRHTPFRSVASVPLSTLEGEVYAALDLYAEDDQLSRRLDVDAINEHLAAPVSALLSMCMAAVRGVSVEEAMPPWYRTATARRHHVWVASGMLMGRHQQSTRDALSVLRAHAYALDRSLDDLADDLIEGRVSLDDLDR
jgi:hypothetical protein